MIGFQHLLRSTKENASLFLCLWGYCVTKSRKNRAVLHVVVGRTTFLDDTSNHRDLREITTLSFLSFCRLSLLRLWLNRQNLTGRTYESLNEQCTPFAEYTESRFIVRPNLNLSFTSASGALSNSSLASCNFPNDAQLNCVTPNLAIISNQVNIVNPGCVAPHITMISDQINTFQLSCVDRVMSSDKHRSTDLCGSEFGQVLWSHNHFQ